MSARPQLIHSLTLLQALLYLLGVLLCSIVTRTIDAFRCTSDARTRRQAHGGCAQRWRAS
eukprot:6340070-Lingulodinium_polyedra.AAC.1